MLFKNLHKVPAEDFRKPLRVTAIKHLYNNYYFPVCPRCGKTLEREYMHYCDRCGQCLSWKHFKEATIL